MRTQLGLGGFGVGQYGSFQGKRGPPGSRPVGKITRLSLDGYGAKRVGSFVGKGGGHPVHRITRLGLDGYGVRRCGSFAGKTAGVVPTPVPTPIDGGGVPGKPRRFLIPASRRLREDEEIMVIIAAAFQIMQQ